MAIDVKYLIDNGDRLILPNYVVPKEYNLHLTPNFKTFTFDGEVAINVNVVTSTNVVIIHAIELKIAGATIQGQTASSIEYYEPEEVAILTFPNQLQVSEGQVLSIKFSGILNDKLKGFYRSKYTINNEDRYIATTQFEATDARRSFPCFDEPALKATFNISLTIDSHLEALSNMPEISITNNTDGTKTFKFEPTPVMSTYLVAYVVGEFSYLEAYTKENIRVRVYKIAGREESCEFALDVATKALSFFIDYFNIPFPLKKCDHIAIMDFAFGAMENWGLITYREAALLTSDKTTIRVKQRIANVIGHELAHQWFGNLVSPSWWSQLWLNEGFATFMGYLVTDKLFPEWDVWMNFLDMYGNGALNLDALENSHPVEVPVRSSSQINEIFDAISYNKGSCIIRMLEDRFGDNFRKGLSHYLNKHSFGNTKTEDLWESISLATGVDVNSYIDNFTKKSGYAVIKFKSTGTPGKFEISQRQFRLTNVEKADDPIWNCYIKIQTNNGPIDFMLNKKTDTITIPNFTWMKPNYGQAGYYRIEYDAEIIRSLIPLIKTLELPATDRLGLLSDTYQLCKAGVVPISVYMELVSAYVNENESAIWDQIVTQLVQLTILSEDQDYVDKLKEFQVKLLKPISKSVGFLPVKDESSTKVLLRERINARLGNLGEPEILSECRKYFESYKQNPSSVPTDIITVVLLASVKHGGEPEQNAVITSYLKSTSSTEKNIILGVIASNPNPELIRKALDFSLSKDVRIQDTYIVWGSIPSKGQSFAWSYFEKNFPQIFKSYGANALVSRMISSVLPYKATEAEIKHIQKFFTDNVVPIADRSIKQDLEKLQINSNWFNSFNNDLRTWLNTHNN